MKNRLNSFIAFVLCFALTAVIPRAGFAQDELTAKLNTTLTTKSTSELSPAEIYERSEGSVVMIMSYDKDNALLSYGSGVIVSTGGIVYTNYHVIKNASRIEVRNDNTVYDSIPLAGFDPFIDCAILQLPNSGGGYPFIPLNTSSTHVTGSAVYALGNPKGYKKTLTQGIISATRPDDHPFTIQYSASASPGSSGGALLNTSGELIGITSSYIIGAEDINFAVPTLLFSRCAVINSGDTLQGGWLYKMFGYYNNSINTDFDERLDVISRYTELYQNDTARYEFAGQYYQNLSEDSFAVNSFTKAIEISPGDKRLYLLRGVSYAALYDTMNALNDFALALQTDDKYLDAYLERAKFYEYTLKDYRRAIDDYRAVVKLNPEYDYVYSSTAGCMLSLGDKPGAIEELSHSLLWKTDNVSTYTMRAEIYAELAMYEEAIDDYTSALEITPVYKELYLSRGVLYSKLGYYSSAIADYIEYIRYDPAEAVAHNNLGYCYMELGDYEQAEKCFKRSLAVDMYHTDSNIGLAILYYIQKRTRLVVENMCRALEIKDVLYFGMPGLAEMERAGWFWSAEHRKVIKNIFRLMGITDSKVEYERNINPRAQQQKADGA